MSSKDIMIPSSFLVMGKSSMNTPGLIPKGSMQTQSLIDWTNARLMDGLIKVSVNSLENIIGGSYANNTAAAVDLSVGQIYFNTTTGTLAAVTA